MVWKGQNTRMIDNAITHAGKFHADDVFGAALLKIVFPKIRIARTFRVPGNFDGIVFDIGFGEFDHHQADAKVRPNGVPYAAFGLLWKEYGQDALRKFGCKESYLEQEATHFDEKFIQPLDLDDNTGCGNPLAGIINTFNPPWDSKADANTCFFEAVMVAGTIMEKKLENMMSIQRARAMVEKALGEAENHIVILPKHAPWKPSLSGTDAEFVVYPSQRGGFGAQSVQMTTAKVLRYPFPAAWAGQEKHKLPKLSGIPTLNFCHNSRFLVTADTLEDAIAACRMARADADSEVEKTVKTESPEIAGTQAVAEAENIENEKNGGDGAVEVGGKE